MPLVARDGSAMRRMPDMLWVVVWGLLSSGWILSAAGQLSATFDEPFYLRSAIKAWRTGSNFELMKAGTMPLPVDTEYLPVYLWEQIRGERFDEEAEFHKLLTIGRAGNLIFWWLLLVYAFRLGNWYAGSWAGRLAVLLVATEPSLLGHACLATTDIAISATMFIFTYHYLAGRGQSRWRRWFVPGILYGIAMTAKASALTFVPIVIFAIELPCWWKARIWAPSDGSGRIRYAWRHIRDWWWDYCKMLAIATVVLWGYCGCDWARLPSFVKWADTVQDETWGPKARWAAEHLRIFPNAGQAIAYQIKHNIRGHGAYLLGEWYPRAVRYYFPVALTIKLTIPVLALFLLLLTRPRAFSGTLAIITLLMFLFTFNVRVQIGIRLIFPFVCFFLILLAVASARIAEQWQSKFRWAGITILSAVLLYPPLMIWPDGLRYANELWGGPNEVHRHIGDSNSDWGQGVIDLEEWTRQHDLPPAKVWYYGMDPKITNDPNRLMPLHHSGLYQLKQSSDTAQIVKGHVLAVSKTILWGDPAITPTMPFALEYIRSQKPIAETRSFLIYDFRQP